MIERKVAEHFLWSEAPTWRLSHLDNSSHSCWRSAGIVGTISAVVSLVASLDCQDQSPDDGHNSDHQGSEKPVFLKAQPGWVFLGFIGFWVLLGFFGRAVPNDVKYTWKGKMTNRRLIVNFWKRTMINYLHILGVFYTLNYASVPEVNC